MNLFFFLSSEISLFLFCSILGRLPFKLIYVWSGSVSIDGGGAEIYVYDLRLRTQSGCTRWTQTVGVFFQKGCHGRDSFISDRYIYNNAAYFEHQTRVCLVTCAKACRPSVSPCPPPFSHHHRHHAPAPPAITVPILKAPPPLLTPRGYELVHEVEEYYRLCPLHRRPEGPGSAAVTWLLDYPGLLSPT